MTDFNEWKASMNKKFDDEIRTPEQKNNAIIKDKVFQQTIRIESSVIDFDVRARLLPRHRRLLSNYKDIGDVRDYDTIQDAFATVLGELSVDSNLDKEFWKSLDEETGYLPEIFAKVSKVISESEESAVNFR